MLLPTAWGSRWIELAAWTYISLLVHSGAYCLSWVKKSFHVCLDKNWVPSMLPHNLWLNSVGMKKKDEFRIAKQTASECNWCLFQITRFPIKVISNQPTFCMTERRRYSNWLILALLKELVKPLKIRSPNQDTLNVNESWPLVIWRILWNHHHHVVLVIKNEE